MARHQIAVSRESRDALSVLGHQIHQARIAKGWTLSDTAERMGVDQRTIRAAEQGSPTVAIGTVFNLAFLLGVNLFGLDRAQLAAARYRGQDTLALLPLRVRTSRLADDRDIDF